MCVELKNRVAKCVCGKTAPSDDSGKLAFFKFKGEGSEWAKLFCKNCGFSLAWHDKAKADEAYCPCDCENFESLDSFEFDSYYCGHAGWE